MGKQTALYQTHVDSDAKIVDFGGWDMPLHYGSQIREHHAVRGDAGMFDVSHMTVVDLLGGGAKPFLQHLLANDVGRLKNPGKALYSCMLNESGGVVDDLIVYYRGEDNYRMVVNAATRDKDMAWITRHGKDFDLQIVERPELAMIAVQGPNARAKTLPLLPDSIRDACAALKPFTSAAGEEWFVGRTGYTGEDGFEIILPPDQAVNLWVRLAAAGVAPCGLGARDTLRLEAGMNLYGSDMDEQTSPLEAGLGWTVAWEPTERVFIGRGPLDALRSSGAEKNSSGWSCGTGASCVTIKPFWRRAVVRERSPAAAFPLPWKNPSPWRGFRLVRARPAPWKCVASTPRRR